MNANLEKLRLTGATVLCQDALLALRQERAAGRRYDLVLVDPPYEGFEETLQMRLSELLPPVLADDGLLVVDFARKHDAKTMVKGLRVIADFEWEFQMNHLNRLLAPEIETMYVMSSPAYSFVSSSGVKEIASFGGKVDELVPETVARRFRELFPQARPGAPVSPRE